VSALDLINEWEDALLQALQPTVGPEVSDEDLERARSVGVPLRAGIRAGLIESDAATCVPGVCGSVPYQ